MDIGTGIAIFGIWFSAGVFGFKSDEAGIVSLFACVATIAITLGV